MNQNDDVAELRKRLSKNEEGHFVKEKKFCNVNPEKRVL